MELFLFKLFIGTSTVFLFCWLFGYANYLYVYWKEDWDSYGNHRMNFKEWIMEHGLDNFL